MRTLAAQSRGSYMWYLQLVKFRTPSVCFETKKTLSSLPVVDLCLSIDTKGEFYWRICDAVCTRSARITDRERLQNVAGGPKYNIRAARDRYVSILNFDLKCARAR